MEISTNDLKIPIVIGVTGHRDIPENAIEHLENKIRTIFNYITDKYEDTPIILLSPLADGADRIVANIALKEFATKITVSVPMPFDKETYKNTFGTSDKMELLLDNEASQKDFEEMLLKIKNQKNIFVAEKIFMPYDGKNKNYSFVGEYVAIHSQILIALHNPCSEGKNGGTAEILDKKLSGNYDFVTKAKDRVSLPERGIVYRIITPRINHTAIHNAYKLTKLFPSYNEQGYQEIEWGINDDQPSGIKKLINFYTDYMSHLNTKPCLTKSEGEQENMTSFRREHKQINCINKLIESNSEGIQIRACEDLAVAGYIQCNCDSHDDSKKKKCIKNKCKNKECKLDFLQKSNEDKLRIRQIVSRSSFAYLSRKFQDETKYYEMAIIILIFISSLTVFFIPNLDIEKSITSVIYILIVFLFYIVAVKFKFFKNLYEDTRALSEGLRVQNAWKDIGIDESVSFSYPSSYKDELNWIRTSLRSLNIFSSLKSSKILNKDKEDAIQESWINEQIVYFEKHQKYQITEDRYEKIIQYTGIATLVFSSLFTIDTIYSFIDNKEYIQVFKIIAGGLFTIAAVTKAIQHYDGYSEIIKEYKLSLAHFQRAKELLKDDKNDKKKIYESLGIEALQENTFWTILRRKKNYKSPSV